MKRPKDYGDSRNGSVCVVCLNIKRERRKMFGEEREELGSPDAFARRTTIVTRGGKTVSDQWSECGFRIDIGARILQQEERIGTIDITHTCGS